MGAQHKWQRKCCILVCILIGLISVYLCNVVTLNAATQKREVWDVIAQAELWGMQAYVSSCTETRTNTNTYCWFDKEIQHILWCAPASCQLTAELNVPTAWTEWSCCPTQRLSCSLMSFPENKGGHRGSQQQMILLLSIPSSPLMRIQVPRIWLRVTYQQAEPPPSLPWLQEPSLDY